MTTIQLDEEVLELLKSFKKYYGWRSYNETIKRVFFVEQQMMNSGELSEEVKKQLKECNLLYEKTNTNI